MVLQQLRNQIQDHFRPLILFLLTHSEMAFLMCLGSFMDSQYSPSGLPGGEKNSWFYQICQVVQVLKQQSNPQASFSSFILDVTPSKMFKFFLYYRYPAACFCPPSTLDVVLGSF
ncbi:hypothetical protein ILYODFUR_028304 [Ilyodon furcidens]|uniref:Uncharacterized protein n=1 Tax=Ilyodon furcidens TaxID=33524 RepID=A0ABV0VIJ1_9TELE